MRADFYATPPLPVELHHKHLFRFFVSFELDGKKRKENRETRLIRADCSPFAADLNLHKRRAAIGGISLLIGSNMVEYALNMVRGGLLICEGIKID